jgi:hypothetical protein
MQLRHVLMDMGFTSFLCRSALSWWCRRNQRWWKLNIIRDAVVFIDRTKLNLRLVK